jgi:hypothetical protein
MGSRVTFTDAQLQAAATKYIASGSYPSWWTTLIQGLRGSGGSVAEPTTADVRYQQAAAAAQAAQQAYLSRIRPTTTSTSDPWVMVTRPQGAPGVEQVYYMNTITGEQSIVPNMVKQMQQGSALYTNTLTGSQSRTAPSRVIPAAAPQTATPSLDQVSNYLTNLLSGSAPAQPLTYAQLSAQAAAAAAAQAGSAQAQWLSGIRPQMAGDRGGSIIRGSSGQLFRTTSGSSGLALFDPLESQYLPGSATTRYGSLTPPTVVYPRTSGSGSESYGSRETSTDWMFTDKQFRVTFPPPPIDAGLIRMNLPPPVTEDKIYSVIGNSLGQYTVTPVSSGTGDSDDQHVFILYFENKGVTKELLNNALAKLNPVSIEIESNVNTVTTTDETKQIQKSTDIDAITYSASINDEPRANGPITTLLDLVNRDQQENDFFPLRTEITWFARDTERRILPFAPVLQEIALRGPGAFGQRFTFDLGSIVVGDLLLGTVLQIQLDHWLDAQTLNMYQAEKLAYGPDSRSIAWEYANSLGTSIIQQAELEIDGKTIETIDGDFIHVFSALFPEFNTQVGIAYDHLGQVSIKRLTDPIRRPRIYPVENGNLNCILPFFFMRTRLKEALPMIAIREGYVKIHVTLRPFSECVRQMRGFRDSCESVPSATPTLLTPNSSKWTYNAKLQSGSWDVIPKYSFTIVLENISYNWNFTADTKRGNWVTPAPTLSFTTASSYTWTASTSAWTPYNPPLNIAWPLGTDWYYWDEEPQAWRSGNGFKGAPTFNLTYGDNVWESKVGDWSVTAPPFKSVQLLAYGAIVDGTLRKKMLRDPFEILHRQVQTFSFDEPLKYAVSKRADSDSIRIQLPLEANHPIEEILWFVRRKGTSINNEWTNYSSLIEKDWNSRAPTPLLQNAILQVNGTVICDAEEQFYREQAAYSHRGGYASFSKFIYGYSFAASPGEHQPSGSLNASRVNSLRLVLDVKPPGEDLWEVKVFCIGLNWMRFENGLANPMFED